MKTIAALREKYDLHMTVERVVSENIGSDEQFIRRQGEAMTIRTQLDAYVKEKYGIDPEILPFSKENYGVYRHLATGRWFAVFIVKERSAFGLPGSGAVEVVSFRIRDKMLSDFVMQQPGYLRGFPACNWNWTTAVLDGTIAYEDICRWIDESYAATNTKGKNKRTPLPKAEP